jgi:hypothetical protein
VGVHDLDDEAFTALYGTWAPRTPVQVAELFEGYAGAWWVAGGWALEAFTGVPRPHDDIDPCVLREELPRLRRHLAGRLHLWSACAGALAPLLPDEDPDVPADAVLPAGCGQLWTRRSAQDPWEYDVLLNPGGPQEWVYKRDDSVRMPLQEAIWERDGVWYLQPEIQLLHKAAGLRPKDQADFDATLPHLDERRRDWLAETVQRTLGAHPWLTALGRARRLR